MAAAVRGNVDATEHLLSLGAKVTLRNFVNNKTALDWANATQHQDIADLLQAYMSVDVLGVSKLHFKTLKYNYFGKNKFKAKNCLKICSFLSVRDCLNLE